MTLFVSALRKQHATGELGSPRPLIPLMGFFRPGDRAISYLGK